MFYFGFGSSAASIAPLGAESNQRPGNSGSSK
jgi:hypothetical protein